MKPDKLEQFMLDNRSDFDDLAPSADSWKQIKANVRPIRRINWTARLVRVAAAVVIFVSGYIFIDYTFNKNYGSERLAGQNGMEIYENIPVLLEARAYYSGQISNMEAEVYRISGADSPLRAEIDIEFEELDRVFTELKADLKDNAANEEVIEAMIQNYRIKLQILEEILLQLKNADKQNIEEDEDKKVLL
jgi:hypothetical protein